MLATADDLATFGYAEAVAAHLAKADARVRGYLSRRLSAQRVLADGATVPPALAEIVCAVASRMASTPAQVAMGVRSEGSGAESVTWGAEAYSGVTDLTASEKSVLDRLYPVAVRTAQL